MADDRLRAAVLPVVRERIAAKLEASGFAHDHADLEDSVQRAAVRIELAIDELVDVAARPALRRIEQAALDRAEENRIAASKAKREAATEKES